MTEWLCIATEGETVDKRFLTQQMLIDAAETYNPNLYTALLWPEHGRSENVGEVLDVKAEAGGDGLIRLYARLCPSVELIYANHNGKLIFTSVELTPDGDFRGTGRYYLEGLGVTDEPASVGTTRMRFNKRTHNYLIGKSVPLKFNKVKEVNMAGKEKSKSKWRSLFSIEDEQTQEEETQPEPDKLQAMAEALAALENRVAALETKTDETDSTVDDIQSDVETVKEVVDTEEFARLRDNLPAIVKNFSKQVTTLPKNNPKGTKSKFKFL